MARWLNMVECEFNWKSCQSSCWEHNLLGVYSGLAWAMYHIVSLCIHIYIYIHGNATVYYYYYINYIMYF